LSLYIKYLYEALNFS